MSEHRKCENLVVAYENPQRGKKRGPNYTTTFWKITHCMQFLSYASV